MSKKLYFAPSIDDERCYTLDSIVDQMKSYSLSETEIKSAVKDSSLSGYFYCKHYGSVGESIEGACGKHCDGYSPRNGKSGNCRHKGSCYSQSDDTFLLKLVNGKPVVSKRPARS
jgi:hypothetical protein